MDSMGKEFSMRIFKNCWGADHSGFHPPWWSVWTQQWNPTKHLFNAGFSRYKRNIESTKSKKLLTCKSKFSGIFGCSDYIWGFPKMVVPQNGWWKSWKTLLKWMIWGYHHLRKHPYGLKLYMFLVPKFLPRIRPIPGFITMRRPTGHLKIWRCISNLSIKIKQAQWWKVARKIVTWIFVI